MTKTFVIPTPPPKQNPAVKKKSRQKEPKVFLEYKSDIAITTDHKRKGKRKKSYIETVMRPRHCTHSFYSKARGRKEPP